MIMIKEHKALTKIINIKYTLWQIWYISGLYREVMSTLRSIYNEDSHWDIPP